MKLLKALFLSSKEVAFTECPSGTHDKGYFLKVEIRQKQFEGQNFFSGEKVISESVLYCLSVARKVGDVIYPSHYSEEFGSDDALITTLKDWGVSVNKGWKPEEDWTMPEENKPDQEEIEQVYEKAYQFAEIFWEENEDKAQKDRERDVAL